MARSFRVIDEISIEFDENILQWSVHYDDVFRIRQGRSLVVFNEVNVAVLDLLYDYDLTDEEHKLIRDSLWFYFFGVYPSR